MKSWRCDICGATGTAVTAKVARGEYDRHYYQHHYTKGEE